MISARMTRPVKLLVTTAAFIALAALAGGCGTQKIAVASSNPLRAGAVLFNQRCAGCHTLSYAATNGSASNVRSAQYNNGPNFNVRCERPVDRVLYAIENGGFSGAIMPQNIVVGPEAMEVAQFVATYAGRQAPKIPGTIQCTQQPVGTIDTTPPSNTSSTATGVAPNPAHGGIPGAAPPNLHPKKPTTKKK
jgi:mono/diheme cytochrome c family protein